MKLSNKILIGFFGLILLYMTVAFTEIRLKGDLNRMDNSNSLAETVEVDDFKYLVINNLYHSVKVAGADTPRIEVRSATGDLLKHLQYDLSGDTLSLLQVNLEDGKGINITVYVPKTGFHGLTSHDSGLIIDGLEQDSVFVHQTKGWTRLLGSNKISQLNIKASNEASFNISDVKLDLLNVQLDDARVDSNASVRLLEGSITNDSYIFLQSNNEIRLKKDESSRIDLY